MNVVQKSAVMLISIISEATLWKSNWIFWRAFISTCYLIHVFACCEYQPRCRLYHPSMIFYCDSKIRNDWKINFSDLHQKLKVKYSCLHHITLVRFQCFPLKGIPFWIGMSFLVFVAFFASFPSVPFLCFSYSLTSLYFLFPILFVLSVLIHSIDFSSGRQLQAAILKINLFLTSVQLPSFQTMVLLDFTNRFFKRVSAALFVHAQ